MSDGGSVTMGPEGPLSTRNGSHTGHSQVSGVGVVVPPGSLLYGDVVGGEGFRCIREERERSPR